MQEKLCESARAFYTKLWLAIFTRAYSNTFFKAKYVYKIASLKVLVNQPTLYDVYTSLFGKNITSLELVKLDLMTFGPVVLCFNVFESFLHYYQGRDAS